MTFTCERIEELVPKVVDRQALDWEEKAVEEHLAGCAACAERKDDLVRIGTVVRGAVTRAVARADFSGLWDAVSARLDAAPARAEPVRAPRLGFAWASRFGAAFAMAATVALALFIPWEHPHHYAEFDNRVEVDRIEGGADNTVMIYESPDQGVTFIWVIPEVVEEKPS